MNYLLKKNIIYQYYLVYTIFYFPILPLPNNIFYLNALNILLVVLSLSNLLIIKIVIPTNKNVIPYTNKLTNQLPAIILVPAKTPDIIDGNLAKEDITINLEAFIGNKPPI